MNNDTPVDFNAHPKFSRNQMLKALVEIENAFNNVGYPSGNEWMKKSHINYEGKCHNKLSELLALLMSKKEYDYYRDCNELITNI